MTGKTEIWYLIGNLTQGGAEKTLVDLANSLPRTDYEVTVWTIQDRGPLRSELEEHVTYRSIGAENKTDIVAILYFLQSVRRERPPILQSFLFFDNTLARLAGALSPETIVITGVRAVPDQRPLFRSLIDRATLPLSDHIVSNSIAGAEWIVENGANPNSVSVIYNGRNIERYSSAEAPSELSDKLAIDKGPVIGTVGRLIERKGHYDLLEAWPTVLENYPNATLLLVGDGPEREALQKFATALGCASSVRFLGMRDDVPELLALLDIFVFPSHFEGLPGALLEAMAAGLPIVCTPVDGNSELIVDGESGLFVTVKSPDQISGRLIALLEDIDKREQLAEGAQKRAETNFTLQSMASEFSQLYE
ncbi:glycosyltransferase [Halostagnicola bangensis]